jgi:predicted nucleic acid-binding protein
MPTLVAAAASAQPTEFFFSFSHKIYYSNRHAVPAEEVAEALLGLSRIVQKAPLVFKGLVSGCNLPKAALYVESIENGSLSEEVIVKFFFGSKRKMDRCLKRWREALGINLETAPGVLRTIIIALIFAGAVIAAQRYLSPAEKATIEMNHNTVINIGAAELQMTPDQLRAIITTVISNKDQLAADAVAVIRPAKRDRDASITFDNDPAKTIPPTVIDHIPSTVDPVREEDSTMHEHVTVELRALDLDSNKSGWAAVAPRVAATRLKLELGPNIQPEHLFGKASVTGTVEVVKRRNGEGTMVPKLIRLLEIDDVD